MQSTVKRILWLAVIAALCFTATVGCAPKESTQTGAPIKPTSNFPSEPPLLSVSDGISVVYAWRGTYSWNVKKSDGTGTGVNMDSPHPLDCVGNIPAVPITEKATLTLTFESAPSEIVVRRHESSANSYDKYAEIKVTGSSIEVKQGNYLYEVIATWEDRPLRSYSGTAHYAFCTVK